MKIRKTELLYIFFLSDGNTPFHYIYKTKKLNDILHTYNLVRQKEIEYKTVAERTHLQPHEDYKTTKTKQQNQGQNRT